MNKHFKKVLSVLRTKAKALGLNYKELKGVAAKIADNLELDDEASEEDVNSAIEESVDDAMSFLSVSQSAAQRAIANYKAKHNISDDDADDDEDFLPARQATDDGQFLLLPVGVFRPDDEADDVDREPEEDDGRHRREPVREEDVDRDLG